MRNLVYRFPKTVAGKLEFEMKFKLLERRGTVREIPCGNSYALEFEPGGVSGYGGITVIK